MEYRKKVIQFLLRDVAKVRLSERKAKEKLVFILFFRTEIKGK